jgi:DNA integrity scanning protein DisA with diadenylate cyclase activity
MSPRPYLREVKAYGQIAGMDGPVILATDAAMNSRGNFPVQQLRDTARRYAEQNLTAHRTAHRTA